jgi:hypothetical protein
MIIGDAPLRALLLYLLNALWGGLTSLKACAPGLCIGGGLYPARIFPASNWLESYGGIFFQCVQILW